MKIKTLLHLEAIIFEDMYISVYDNEWIILSDVTPYEGDNIERYFTKNIPDWFIIKKMNKNAIVKESFIQDRTYLPIGLWVELMNCISKYGLSVTFDPIFNDTVTDELETRQKIQDFSDNLFANAPYKPKGYQLDAVFNAVYYKKSCLEITTNGGKTLISYVLFKYLREVKGVKRILYITPKTNLTTQSSGKFAEYDNACGINSNWTYGEVTGVPKKKAERIAAEEAIKNADIVFGNYQSLRKYDSTFLSTFDCVIVDEAHHAIAKSIRNILSNCHGAVYKIGMTGTFPKDGTYESLLVQSYIGALVYRFTSHQLIEDEKFATPVVVYGIQMDYLSDEEKENLYKMRIQGSPEDATYGNKMLDIEQTVCRESLDRLKYVCDMIKRVKKNSLVIFTDKKSQYGYKIYTKLKDETDKNVYYIDGDTSTNARDQIIAQMEKDTTGNTIIVSSVGCFSEGIDISNLWYIFLAESTKSDTTIAQLLGRGMRRYAGKDKTILVDFGDDYSYTPKKRENSSLTEKQKRMKKNYLFKHFVERGNIYTSRSFTYTVKNVKFGKNVLTLF